MIRHLQDIPERELGVTLVGSQDDSGPVRPEGINVSAQVLKEVGQVIARGE
ncbi:MAG: hypothetical protein ACXVB0_22990 [Mucilaginibacter sp.]